jgi:hypothetical protein
MLAHLIDLCPSHAIAKWSTEKHRPLHTLTQSEEISPQSVFWHEFHIPGKKAVNE